MKKLFLLTLGAALLMVTACRQVDEELVGKMQADLTKIKESEPEIASLVQRSAELMKNVSEAPNGMKYKPEYGIMEINQMIGAINGKCTSVQQTCLETAHQLDSLITNYSNGNIEKEAVMAEYETIAPTVSGITGLAGKMGPFLDRASANFTKSMDAWQALSDSEKKSAEKAAEAAANADATTVPGFSRGQAAPPAGTSVKQN